MFPIKCSAIIYCDPEDVSLLKSLERHQARSKKLDISFIEKITGISEPSLVQALDITNRDLSSWEAKDFKEYINLKDIEAGGNSLSLDAFIYLTDLQALNLQCNNITVFQIDCLSDHFKRLKILDLSYNALSSDAIIRISELPNLYKVNLSGNDIDWFPDCADIAQAPLPSTTVAGRFQGFPKLQYLDLDSNRISDQSSITHISKLPSLRCLRLDNNQLPSLICLQPVEQEDFMFEGFKQLEELSIIGNNIKAWNDLLPFAFLPTLKLIHVDQNPVILEANQDAIDSFLTFCAECNIVLGDERFSRLLPSSHSQLQRNHYDRKENSYFNANLMNCNSFKIVEDYSSKFHPGAHHSRENLKVSPNKLVLDPISSGDGESVPASLNLVAEEASFKIEDDFFITGTNLEELPSLSHLNDQLEALDLDAYFSQYFLWNPVNQGYSHFFPKSIQDSIRLLRQAVTNPVFYWRIVDKTYTQQTFATRQKTLRCDDRVQKDIRRNHFRSNSSNLYFVYAKSRSDVTSRKTTLAFNRGLGRLDNSSRNFNSLDCVDNQSKTLGKHPSMNQVEDQSHRRIQNYERDGVRDLQQMMDQVVKKLQTLEQRIRYHRWNIQYGVRISLTNTSGNSSASTK